ncbi:MAG: hypothetical protein A2Z86_11870 [Candidatus Glassbacteria bacterium GWA2_58_10]|uniref:3-deoxy-D-manno-octulosonic acid transferase n=1 Tax=Candidatus Glassbacteria bacterium GWA2_58_10 TaxID=1817865 RepID=A0A1F5YDY3_9BACT|nr:MAG: hypothetical protein A2Z86_11870 [Candidatus Glassbacteria bacterium GWA2_58_10]
MDLWQLAYNCFGLPLARGASRLAALLRPKFSQGLRGRRGSFREIDAWLAGRGAESPAGGSILFHVTSVGEYLQALPLMKELKERDSSRPVFLSFFSPSVEKRARACPHADLAFYLPEDTRSNIRRLLGLLKPKLIVISKFDIWPNLVILASRSGIPLVVIAATLSPGSGRLRGISGLFHRSFYRRLNLICAISEHDARNFTRLGVAEENCIVTGDTRFDQTFQRASEVPQDHPLVLPFRGWEKNCFRLACGSVWPADLQRLLPALAQLTRTSSRLRIILAPHEPTREQVARLTAWLERHKLSYELYSTLKSRVESQGPAGAIRRETRAVVVDIVGVLAAVYRAADAAYVGGSFGKGVHNTMEPACFGLPVLFGPQHRNSYEATLMLEAGGAFAVRDSRQAATIISHFLSDEIFLRHSGERTREVVLNNLGATWRTLEALAQRFPQALSGK